MKKVILFLSLFVAAITLNAQITTPQPSPLAKMEQKVGLTDVSLVYSRPSMKGRTIFGNLVPYDKVWRTGANARTKITFSTDVTVDGQVLKAGSYAVYTKPTKTSWEVYFYTEADGGGLPQTWDDTKVAAKTTVSPIQMPVNIESFTMTFDDLTNDSAVIGILWEKTYVGIPFKTPTETAVLASINATMSGPSANDFYQSAVYYLENGKDINKAKTWIDQAIAKREQPAFWMYRQKSLIYAKSGDKKGAIKAAKESLKLAKAAPNADYVKLNEDSLKEWGAL